MKNKKEMTDEEIAAYPPHMQNDYRRRNDNIKSGHSLCKECGGTGNWLSSMYRTCPECQGTGSCSFLEKGEDERRQHR